MRLPAQIPGFGKCPDEWVVEVIVDHQGRGIDSEFEIQWKAGDRTWAPYCGVAHLMALERYCELMGVSGPGGLLTKRSKGANEAKGIIISTVRFEGGLDYKNPLGRGEEVDISLMPRRLSHESFLACVTYAQQVSDWRHSRGPPPNGPPPSGYNDYIIMLDDRDRTMERYYDRTRPAEERRETNSSTISMPPEAFNHLIDSQVRTMEIATGARPAARRYENPFPVRPFDHYGDGRGRGRGRYRGRSWTNPATRGTRGRAIPNGIGNNRRPRPSLREIREAEETAETSGPPVAGGSRWRESTTRSDVEAASDAEGSIITDESERAFFDDVPAEEYEAAASFRMEALKLREKADEDARMEEGEAGPSNKGGNAQE